MQYYTINPPAGIARYIRCFWVLKHSGAYIHRSIADGCAEMVFHYHGMFDEIMGDGTIGPSFTAGLHGPSRNVRRFTINSGFGIFGVYLYPYAIRQLFAMPAHVLSDEMPDIITLLGQEGKDLQEQVMLAANNTERVNIMVAFFERRITKVQLTQPPVTHIIKQVVDTKGMADVDTLAAQCYLSRRQFERTFKEYAGFSPALYARIIRFQAATKEYYKKPKSLTDIAYSCGYYDQSHFIHEFKAFSGFHPKEYFLGAPEGMGYRDVE